MPQVAIDLHLLLRSILIFLGSVAGCYIVLRLVLVISFRALRTLSHKEELLNSVLLPFHILIITFSLVVGVGLTVPPSWLLVHELFKALLFVSLVWVAVRVVLAVTYAAYIEDSPLRSNVPVLIQKAMSGLLYSAAAFAVVHFYFGFNMTGVLIALGAVALVGSIAFQDTLRSFFAGISLNLDDTFHVGDFVKISGFTGEVVDTNFRTTTLRSTYDDYVTIPNRTILESPIINFHQPQRLHRGLLTMPVSREAPPNEVREVLANCASMAEGVLANPPPEVLVKDFADTSILYTVSFWVQDYRENARVEDRIRTLAWYRLRREGFLPSMEIPAEEPLSEAREGRRSRENLARLQEVPLLESLKPAQMKRLASLVKAESFGRGEYLFYKGDEGGSFYVVKEGEIDIRMDLPDEKGTPRRQTIATIPEGGFFGERSLLTGEARSAHAVAARDSIVLVIDKAAFQEILTADPTIAERLSDYLIKTIEKDRERAGTQASAPQEAAATEAEKENLLDKIRAFFDLR